MKRSAPPKRKTTPKRRRSKPRRSERVRDPEYLAWLHTLPCYLAAPFDGRNCEGPVEADHVGERPLGRKCSDREAVALCRKHHLERHTLRGAFLGVGAEHMRAWAKVAIQLHQEAYSLGTTELAPF